MPLAHLLDRAVLKLSGADTRAFLQGQVTNDLSRLAPETPLYAGLLSPQGKTLFAFLLFQDGEDVLIDCAASQADALMKRLTMFRLRRAISIVPDPRAVFQAFGDTPAPDGAAPDPRTAAAGKRWIAAPGSTSPTATLADWHHHRLRLGLPDADELGSDALLWLETNARELNGVSFTKGCYVGQENTARMHHRDKVRKLLLAVEYPDNAADTKLLSGDREAGVLLGMPHGGLQMALLRQDYIDQPLSLGGAPVTLVRPPWLDAQL
jgi:folate-binding protein YgfZ